MDNYEDFTREQLIAKIKTLEAHNTQLQNVIAKKEKSNNTKQRGSKKPFDFEKCKVRHVLLKFFYLGWNYHGFVTQEDTINTIEHHIFEALTKTCLIEKRSSANYHRCGRTDKGVSSFSQVISLDVRSKSDDVDEELDYCKILNGILPADIQFIAWCPVDNNFSARFDCTHRTYKYFFPKNRLDIEVMKSAAKNLEGSHDFRNFCKMDVDNGVVEFTRNIQSVDISSFQDDDDFSIYVLTIRGNAFLWHQIRYIVGVLILIGEHKEEPGIIQELMDVHKNPRKPDYHMASEIPLILYDCHYENAHWIHTKETVNAVASKLYQFWTFSALKTAMVKNMLIDLEKQTDVKFDETSNTLIPGVKPRTYIPLMKRQLCDSLEDKIERSLKRRKRKGES